MIRFESFVEFLEVARFVVLAALRVRVLEDPFEDYYSRRPGGIVSPGVEDGLARVVAEFQTEELILSGGHGPVEPVMGIIYHRSKAGLYSPESASRRRVGGRSMTARWWGAKSHRGM